MAFSGAPSHWKDDTSEQGQSSKALLLLLPRSAFARFGGRGQGHGHRRRRRRNPTDDKSLFGRGRSNGADWSDRPSLVFVTSQQEGQHVCRSTRSLSLSLSLNDRYPNRSSSSHLCKASKREKNTFEQTKQQGVGAGKSVHCSRCTMTIRLTVRAVTFLARRVILKRSLH